MFEKIINHCQNLLYNFPAASNVKHYLDGRISYDTQQMFKFGYFPNKEYLDVLLNDVGKEILVECGAAYERIYKDMAGEHKTLNSILFNHNLIMPYRDVYGEIIAIVGRTILNDEERKKIDIPKYMNTEFKKGQHLFGLYEAKKEIFIKNEAFVVEGQFDCIQAFNKGIKNVVAVGSANITTDQLALLNRYTDNIKLLLDSDAAGNSGRERAHKKFDQLIKLQDIYLPKGYKDLDEYLSDGNTEL